MRRLAALLSLQSLRNREFSVVVRLAQASQESQSTLQKIAPKPPLRARQETDAYIVFVDTYQIF